MTRWCLHKIWRLSIIYVHRSWQSLQMRILWRLPSKCVYCEGYRAMFLGFGVVMRPLFLVMVSMCAIFFLDVVGNLIAKWLGMDTLMLIPCSTTINECISCLIVRWIPKVLPLFVFLWQIKPKLQKKALALPLCPSAMLRWTRIYSFVGWCWTTLGWVWWCPHWWITTWLSYAQHPTQDWSFSGCYYS